MSFLFLVTPMVYEAFGLVLNVVAGKWQEESDAFCGGDDGDNGSEEDNGDLEHMQQNNNGAITTTTKNKSN